MQLPVYYGRLQSLLVAAVTARFILIFVRVLWKMEMPCRTVRCSRCSTECRPNFYFIYFSSCCFWLIITRYSLESTTTTVVVLTEQSQFSTWLLLMLMMTGARTVSSSVDQILQSTCHCRRLTLLHVRRHHDVISKLTRRCFWLKGLRWNALASTVTRDVRWNLHVMGRRSKLLVYPDLRLFFSPDSRKLSVWQVRYVRTSRPLLRLWLVIGWLCVALIADLMDFINIC